MSTDINSTQKHRPQWHKKLVTSLEGCKRYDRLETSVKGCLGLIFLFIVLPGLMFWLAGLWTDGFRESMPPGLVILLVFGCLLVARVFVIYPLVSYFSYYRYARTSVHRRKRWLYTGLFACRRLHQKTSQELGRIISCLAPLSLG